MIFLKYKDQTRIVHLPESLSILTSNIRIMFPSLTSFQIEFESNGQKQFIDSNEIFSMCKGIIENQFQASMKLFVKETPSPPQISDRTEDKTPLESGVDVALIDSQEQDQETPMSRRDKIREKILSFRTSLDAKLIDFNKSFEEKIGNLDEKNREKLEKAKLFRDRALTKGTELGIQLERKLRMIVL